MRSVLVSAAFVAAAITAFSQSVQIEPVAYAMSNGQCGAYCYFDNGYSGIGNAAVSGATLSGGLGQLTDGLLGGAGWNQNLGNGVAQEWVGWNSITPQITFDFGTAKCFDKLALHCSNGSSAAIGHGGVNLFGSATVQTSQDGTTWSTWIAYFTSSAQKSVVGSQWVTIDPVGFMSARFLRVTLSDGNGPWVFVSEFDFYASFVDCGALPSDVGVVPASLVVAPSTPLSGSSTTLSVAVVNNGTDSAVVQTSFYEGDPASGGIPVGTSASALGFGQVGTFSTTWIPGSPGLKSIYAVATNTSFADANPANNAAVLSVWVDAPTEALLVHPGTVQGFVGGTFQKALTLENTGSSTLALASLAATSSWISFPSFVAGATLAPGQTMQVVADVDVPPTASGGVGLPVAYAFEVTALSGTANAYSGTLTTNVFAAPPVVATVTATNQLTGTPIAGATVAVDGVAATFVTDAAGQVAIPLPEGQRGFYAYKSGFVAAQNVAVVTAATPNVTVALPPGAALTVQNVVSQPLTTQQIIDRGVTATNPANNVVVDFVVVLGVAPTAPPGSPVPPPIIVPSVEIPSTPLVGSTYAFSAPYAGGGGTYGGGSGGGHVAATFTYPAPGVRHETWIFIPGSVFALKEFREATVLVRNNASASPASAISFQNVSATLTLPNGLSLPDLGGVAQSATQSLGTLDAGAQAQAVFVIRGDVPGVYQISGSATADLWLGVPGVFTATISGTALSPPFEVTTPALRLDVIAPPSVVAGAPFQLGIAVANEGSVVAQQVRVVLDGLNFTGCALSSVQATPNCSNCPAPAAPTSLTLDATGQPVRAEILIGDLPPGSAGVAWFTFISHVTGVVVATEAQVVTEAQTTPTFGAEAAYPGTSAASPDAGCLMLTGVDIGPGSGDAAYVKLVSATPGSTLTVTLDSTNPSLTGYPLLLLADAFTPNGAFQAPPVPFAAPGLWAGPNAIVLVNGQVDGNLLAAGGNRFDFGLPSGFSGLRVLVQGAVGAPGGYCATDAHEIVFE